MHYDTIVVRSAKRNTIIHYTFYHKVGKGLGKCDAFTFSTFYCLDCTWFVQKTCNTCSGSWTLAHYSSLYPFMPRAVRTLGSSLVCSLPIASTVLFFLQLHVLLDFPVQAVSLVTISMYTIADVGVGYLYTKIFQSILSNHRITRYLSRTSSSFAIAIETT